MKKATEAIRKRIHAEKKTEQAREQAALQTECYRNEKQLLPEEFAAIVEKTDGFRNHTIRRVVMNLEGWPKHTCVLELYDGERVNRLIFHQISSFAASCLVLENGCCSELRWGIEEDGGKGRRMTLSVLFDNESSFSFCFRSVAIETGNAKRREKQSRRALT